MSHRYFLFPVFFLFCCCTFSSLIASVERLEEESTLRGYRMRELPSPPFRERATLGEGASPARGVVFDGGGIRGAFSISVFCEICKEALPEDLPPHRYFTHFGGTSTGSLIAIALTMPRHRKLVKGRPDGRWDDDANWLDGPYSPREVKQLYRYLSSQIFVSNDLCGDDVGCCGCMSAIVRVISSVFTCCGRCECKCCALKNCGGLCGSKYTNRRLRHFLQEYFGNTRIRDLLSDITVVAIDVNGRIPVFFNKNKYPETLVRDAALASTAAQTFFPPVSITTHPEIEDDRVIHCVDGGVVDNSPVTPVMIRMLKERREPDDFFLLSIGTGELPRHDRISYLRSAGLLKWAEEVPSQGISASTHAASTHMEELSILIGQNLLSQEKRFFRIQPHLSPEASAMDDHERVPLLIELGEAVEKTNGINDIFRVVVDRIRTSLDGAPHRRRAWMTPSQPRAAAASAEDEEDIAAIAAAGVVGEEKA